AVSGTSQTENLPVHDICQDGAHGQGPKARRATGPRLLLDQIRLDPEIQSRVEIDTAYVDELADALKDDPELELPPVVVFQDKELGINWMADGFHRHPAYHLAGRGHIPVDLRPGTRRDALRFSLGANNKHGLRRKRADKHKVAKTILSDPEWSG